MATATHSPSQSLKSGTSVEALNALPTSHLLSELPIQGNTFLFGLNFKYTEVIKKGLINRLKKNKLTLDLDLSCLIFDEKLKVVDKVWFKQLRDSSEAIRHQGDSLNGKDRGALAELNKSVDVETIELRLERLPATVSHLALIISCYNGYPIRQVERGNLYISDDEGNQIYSSDLTLLSNDSAAICVAIFSRELGEWRYTQHDLSLSNHKMTTMIDQIQSELSRVYA
ncbi:TerD family protein [Psychrobacter sp.]|uniref:TerD family protein n=1 Tax=Psychrobacter sp. TaxID=56811 RepID=UPI0025E01125|nr:TerD family protein [Psychrobacter sp.]